MKIYNFDHEPSFAELWELCVNNLLYDVESFSDDFCNLLSSKGLDKKSVIVDVASGSGFPSLMLSKHGYNIQCTDGFRDEVDLFNKRAEELGIPLRSKEVVWDDLLSIYPKQSLDFIMCRGNSFIYASGGWNSLVTIDTDTAIVAYTKTASIFFELLKPGGFLYIDKFKDTETSHKEKVTSIKVNNSDTEDLIFWTERFSSEKIRKASMLRRKSTGEESGTPNISYDLTFPELNSVLKKAGFSKIENIVLSSEKHFDILLAQK